MIKITLEEELLRTINDLRNKKVNSRIKQFTTYDNEYCILKDSFVVVVNLKKEKISAEIDITDLIKGD